METIEVSVRLPKQILSAVKVREEDLEGLLREVLAVELYRRGEVSLGKATEIAGLSTKWEMMGMLAKHDVFIDYTAEDLEKDAQGLKELFAS